MKHTSLAYKKNKNKKTNVTTRKTLQTHQVTKTTVEQTELETTMAELGTMGVHQTLKTTRAKLKQKAQKVCLWPQWP